MKVVLKEWWKDKFACFLMFMYLIIYVIYMAIDTRMIIMIANALADLQNIHQHIIQLAVVSMIVIGISAIMAYILPTARIHCFTKINNAHIDKLLDADFEMFTKFSCSRIWTAGGFMWNIVNVGVAIIRMTTSAISIVITMLAMYAVGGSVVLPIIALYFCSIFIFRIIYKKFDKISVDSKESLKKRNQEAENIVNGFAEVRSFNTIEAHRKSLHGLNDEIYNLKRKRSSINAAMHGSIELVEKAGMMIAIVYALKLLATGELAQAAAMSLIMYVIRLVNPLLTILDFVDEMAEELALKDDFMKIQEYINRNEINGTINLSSFDHEIVLDDISFSYDDSSNAVNHVNITVKKGQKIGICGHSGGGKSTLFKLINRFYKVNSGKITIDGIDINDISRDSYARFIGSVHQENVIFPGTIRENIMYGSPNALETELVEACKKANIYEFIVGLPEKFETTVGPRGLKLSGGQKQRIALARLFLRNPEIILLDEATSALDNEAETLIQDAIEALSGKTIITIAHRLSTIRNCDKIYVLDSNGVLESGTHDSLVAAKGAYASMLK